MTVLTHVLLFLLSASVIWLLSGMLIDATDAVARRHKKSGFAVAFFVLGFLTSISEMAVVANATLDGVPQVSAGNLLGASLVIILLIIPVLAILGGGIPMTRSLLSSNFALLLGVILLPSLLAFDGNVTVSEGTVIVLLYASLVFRIQKKRPSEETAVEAIEETEQVLLHTRHATLIDIGKIVGGAILIFVAGSFLVDESVYFAKLLHIPFSFIGLLLLSIGTNVPEIVIAIRCVLGRHKDIAFGDYMGSAAANTLLFGFLPLLNGTFTIEASEMRLTFVVFAIGLVLFLLFSRTGKTLSRREGVVLFSLYVLFMMLQIFNAVRIADPALPEDSLKQAAFDSGSDGMNTPRLIRLARLLGAL
ncbi:MAG: hypothetical protein PHE68_05595 [Candidatus Peribacteraceae bacterium]|nr:hypothetical protein [Candidatus Peribacteraceae bacterium]MDD5074273.1 hypothetical protein [Candidatus Peribacteraceae bacterium]